MSRDFIRGNLYKKLSGFFGHTSDEIIAWEYWEGVLCPASVSRAPESCQLHSYISNYAVMTPGVFFIKHSHEVQTPRLASQSGCQLLSLIYIPSVTSVFLSQYSQAFQEISLLSGTVHTLLMQCLCPLTLPGEPGLTWWIHDWMPTSLISYGLELQKLFVGKILVFQNSFYSHLVYIWSTGLAAQPFPKSSSIQTTQEETPRLTLSLIHLHLFLSQPVLTLSSSKFHPALHSDPLTSSLTHTCSSAPGDRSAHIRELLPSECPCVIFHSWGLSLVQD